MSTIKLAAFLLILCLCIPAHAKHKKIVVIAAVIGGAVIAGALASTGQSQQPAREVAAHHGHRRP